MKDMETKEIKKRKEKLEADILSLITEFEKETDVLQVSYVDIETPSKYLNTAEKRKVVVKLEVSI